MASPPGRSELGEQKLPALRVAAAVSDRP